MPAKLVQIRRGTTSNHSIFVGETGEITVDTDKDTVVVHDKATAGGHPLAKEDMTNVFNAVGIPQLKVDQVTPPSPGQLLSVDNMNGLTFTTLDISAEAVGGDLSGTVANAQINANTIGVSELNLNDGNDGQFLKTNGAGVISFATPPTPDIQNEPVGGDVTGTVGNIQIPDNTITSAMIAPGVVLATDIADNAVGIPELAVSDGSDGQVLSTNGAGTLSWITPVASGGGGGNATYVEDVFTGDGTTTTFTLSIAATSEEKLLVFIEGVAQPTGTYTLPTSTTIDITSSPPAAGDSIRVLHMGVASSIIEDNFVGNGVATTFSPLTNDANVKESVLVFVDGVAQPTGSYTLPTTTSIDFPSSPPGNGAKVKVLHLVIAQGIPDNSITTSKIVDANVTDAKIDGMSASKLIGQVPQANLPGSFTGIPTGCIVMWSGSIATIPSGWALCDGNNSTPDLRDRFIVGAGNTYAPTDTGGSTSTSSHALTVDELPAHSHTFSYSAPFQNSPGGGQDNVNTNGIPGTASGGTNSVGGDQGHSHDNTLPPYYALAYIIKT